MKFIPIDRELFKACHMIFNKPKRFSSKHDKGVMESTGPERFWGFAVPGSMDLEYRFDIELLNLFKGDVPTLGRRGFEMLLGMIYFAKRTGSLSGNFRAAEMAIFLRTNPPKSGRFFEDIRRTFYSIVTVEIRSKRFSFGGNDLEERGCRFIIQWEHDVESKEYRYTLNRKVLGVTALWLEDRLNENNIGHGYISYPLAYIREFLKESEKAFRDYLLLTRKTITVRVWTIARDWCGFSDDVLKRRKLVHDRLYEYLRNAVTRGDIDDWKPTVLKLTTWKTEWKITITKPRRSRKKGSGKRRTLSSEEQALVEEIHKWQKDPIHGLKWSDEDLYERLKNTVMAYGVEAIGKLYKEHGLGAYPSVHRFWQGVKKLKAEKEAQAEESKVDYAAV